MVHICIEEIIDLYGRDDIQRGVVKSNVIEIKDERSGWPRKKNAFIQGFWEH